MTTDGKRSAQFEHTLLVTETGVEVLTAAAVPGLDSTYSSVYYNAKALEGAQTKQAPAAPAAMAAAAAATTTTGAMEAAISAN